MKAMSESGTSFRGFQEADLDGIQRNGQLSELIVLGEVILMYEISVLVAMESSSITLEGRLRKCSLIE